MGGRRQEQILNHQKRNFFESLGHFVAVRIDCQRIFSNDIEGIEFAVGGGISIAWAPRPSALRQNAQIDRTLAVGFFAAEIQAAAFATGNAGQQGQIGRRNGQFLVNAL